MYEQVTLVQTAAIFDVVRSLLIPMTRPKAELLLCSFMWSWGSFVPKSAPQLRKWPAAWCLSGTSSISSLSELFFCLF